MSSNTFTYGHLMKIKSLVADMKAVESPERAEPGILEVILLSRRFDQFRRYLWLESHFVMQEPPLEP